MRIIWDTFKDKFKYHPKPTFPSGSRVYKGFQGSGKTYSMVEYAFRIKKLCPKCVIFSNVILKGIDYVYFNDTKGLQDALSYQNGLNGVLVLIDEAHLFFNKKDGIGIDVLTAISQQRKDLRRIVFSSQIWEELDISLRKQVKEIVDCRCIAGYIQVNTISDGETLTYDHLESSYIAHKLYTEIFKHNEFLNNAYDTRQKIIKNNEFIQGQGRGAPPALPLNITQNNNRTGRFF